MIDPISVKLDTTELDKIARGLSKNRDKVMEGLAFQVEALAKQFCPVDTGALRASIHTRTKSGGSTFGVFNLTSIPNRRGTTKKGTSFSSVGERRIADLPAPGGDIVAIVGTGMEYAAYVEFGTVRMASRPYLGPAVEKIAGKLNDGSLWRILFDEYL